MSPVAVSSTERTSVGRVKSATGTSTGSTSITTPIASTKTSSTRSTSTSERVDMSMPTPSTSTTVASDIPRRPSPWHDLAHSLSTTSLPKTPRSSSVSTVSPSDGLTLSSSNPTSDSTTVDHAPSSAYSRTPPSAAATSATGALSTSQALREWEARLTHPASAVRHALVPPSQAPWPLHTSQTPLINHHLTPSPASPSPSPTTTQDLVPPALAHHTHHTPLAQLGPLVPKLAAERDKEGHIEYKLKLIDPTPERFERLVSQLMWRLKQGRNEAIYELGLADDGTVIGLTRSEMDASLRTLELMASELGATVLVLKEIVLVPPGSLTRPLTWSGSTASGSTACGSTACGSTASPSTPGPGWIRPPASTIGTTGTSRPSGMVGRSESEGSGGGKNKKGARRSRRRQKGWTCEGKVWGPGADEEKREKNEGERGRDASREKWIRDGQIESVRKQRRVISDPADRAEDQDGDEEGEWVEIRLDRKGRLGHMDEGVGGRTSSASDDDVPPFHLDLEDSPRLPVRTPVANGDACIHADCRDASPSPTTTTASSSGPSACLDGPFGLGETRRHARRPRYPVGLSEAERTERDRKAEEKARKAAAKRHARRMDLLRGDGMTALTIDVPQSRTAAHPSRDAHWNTDAVLPTPPIAHRPSSLRLASHVRTSASSLDAFLADVLHPLDSLSLSFADVQTVGGSVGSPSAEELICVEALVVRKVAGGGDGGGDGVDDPGGVDDEWYGGEEDGWGLGGNDVWELG